MMLKTEVGVRSYKRVFDILRSREIILNRVGICKDFKIEVICDLYA